MIDHYMPVFVRWIEDWLDAENEIDLMITSFEDFSADNGRFLSKVLDFYGISRERFNDPRLEKIQGLYKFRVGRMDEWKEAFTPAQQARASAMISDRLFQRFGWPRS